MLKVTICTKDNVLRKKLELSISQLMNSNHIDFHLCEVRQSEEIPSDTFLILGDSDALYTYKKKTMMIVVLNNHEHDDTLARLAISAFVEKENVDTQLADILMKWVDYFYDNYHIAIDETHEVFLPEVNYFEIVDYTHIKVYTDDNIACWELPYQYSTFSMLLPKNFLTVGTEYIINLDKVKAFEKNVAIMKDGKEIPQVMMKKVEERNGRFDLAKADEVIAIGDKYTPEKIKKARIKGFLFTTIMVVALLSILTKTNLALPWIVMICLGIFALIFFPSYLSFLGSSGNYYELTKDGIKYYSESSMTKKFKWSQAVLNHSEDKMMKFIPYGDVAYIRVGTRVSANMMSSMFLDFNNQNYTLSLKFETVTDTLAFDEPPTFQDLFAISKFRADIACLLNRLTLLNKQIETGEGILMALNDPNADLSQYMNKRNRDV